MKKIVSFLLFFHFCCCVVQSTTPKNYYALAIAAIKANNVPALEANLKHIHNVDSLICKDSDYSYSLLGYACLYKNMSTVRKLVNAKADISCAFSDEIYIYDALYLAIDSGDLSMVQYFISLGSNVNQPYNEDGLCPLMVSVIDNNVPVAELLLKHGARANGVGNLGGGHTFYPLMTAIENRNKAMVRLLLKYGASKRVKDESGDTPLSLAYRLKATDIIALLKRGKGK